MDTVSNSSTQEGPATDKPSPRAFAIGTGAVFQGVGGSLAAVAVVLVVISTWVIPRASVPMEHWSEFFRREHLGSALWTVILIASLVGGLALAAVGVGLQGERRNSGRAGMLVCGLLTLAYTVVAVCFIAMLGLVFPMLVSAALAMLMAAMFMLAGHSASILRQHPPPPDLNKATPELLEEFRQKRLERLKHYEP